MSLLRQLLQGIITSTIIIIINNNIIIITIIVVVVVVVIITITIIIVVIIIITTTIIINNIIIITIIVVVVVVVIGIITKITPLPLDLAPGLIIQTFLLPSISNWGQYFLIIISTLLQSEPVEGHDPMSLSPLFFLNSRMLFDILSFKIIYLYFLKWIFEISIILLALIIISSCRYDRFATAHLT